MRESGFFDNRGFKFHRTKTINLTINVIIWRIINKTNTYQPSPSGD
ncbi:hypothetical protein AO366_1551 [Moraxella catarrhalis]|nr:hypothetical protein AO366_1551 [Moraxella catarrhalis]